MQRWELLTDTNGDGVWLNVSRWMWDES